MDTEYFPIKTLPLTVSKTFLRYFCEANAFIIFRTNVLDKQELQEKLIKCYTYCVRKDLYFQRATVGKGIIYNLLKNVFNMVIHIINYI